MKLISWNVNGIRACLTKGFMDYFDEQNADAFCLQYFVNSNHLDSQLIDAQIHPEVMGSDHCPVILEVAL